MNKVTAGIALFSAAFYSTWALSVPLEKLTLPDGFKIEVYAQDVTNARQMALGKTGIVYVGSRGEGKVHAVVDTNKDGVGDKVVVVAENLKMPTGLAYKDGDLYVAAVSQVLKYKNIDKEYDNAPEPEVVLDGLPTETHHGWKYIDFGPDGMLYVPVGAPCNICETVGDDKYDDPRFASILKYDLANGDMKWVAKGVRNTVGFDWHPDSKELWFSDNGRDWMGDDIPPCEINRVSAEDQHFGYPYIHGGDIKDPEFGAGKSPDDYVKPEIKLGAHVAPLGVHFYQGQQFPKEYSKSLFVAEHGSWNRSKKSGYRVMRADFDGTEAGEYHTFIEGFLNPDDTVWGRPVALLTMPDGSMLISDDFANVIYKVTYQK
ncbi:PQQ-dependent sugar dehydrogenase [Aliiglaciecola lipolytica]|uniref:DUF7133 domain-containing protein n=1 Tax=Aliiglaciecola lipolytica E3 TaxID=1127673 RepID=K6YCW8_9ALTE|nr:PQQ-dependent sugar dehydrogenase [Aliiglaciecola lipolytica]GAC16042.1 hypothetical protein GLIP_3428 [Aliiglaciecola lipolytica E3]